MKKIKLYSILLVATFVLSLHSHSASLASTIQPVSNEKQPNQVPAGTNIGIVYSTGGLGDLSFNDAAHRGVEAARDKFSNVSISEACGSPKCDVNGVNSAIENFASNSTIDLVIAIGFSSASGVNSSAKAHPDQNFMIIDAVVNQPNVNSITFKEQEGSFLVGAMAAMVTETNTLGFLGGLDIPLINRFLAGYGDGAAYINPDIDVVASYSPDPSNPWNDQTGGKQVGNNFIENGADIIYAAAGGTGIGVINAVEEHNQDVGENETYAIGVDSNQDYISKGSVLTSMIKRVDVAVEQDISEMVTGDWTTGITSLGLEENGVGMSPMAYTMEEANATYEGDTTRWEKVQDLKQAIINGSITVEADPDNVDQIKYEFATEPAETVANPLSLSITPAILGIVSIIALVRIHNKFKS